MTHLVSAGRWAIATLKRAPSSASQASSDFSLCNHSIQGVAPVAVNHTSNASIEILTTAAGPFEMLDLPDDVLGAFLCQAGAIAQANGSGR